MNLKKSKVMLLSSEVNATSNPPNVHNLAKILINKNPLQYENLFKNFRLFLSLLFKIGKSTGIILPWFPSVLQIIPFHIPEKRGLVLFLVLHKFYHASLAFIDLDKT